MNETIVKEFFESLGFIVSQPCKYVVTGGQKTAAEEIALIIVNPLCAEQKIPESPIWKVSDLRGISRAVVGVRGWHTERFYKSIFEKTPEILRFADDAAVRTAEVRLGMGGLAKILCLAELPASTDPKKSALDTIKGKGIDGVLLFRTILRHLVSVVDKHKNYEKSDVLQVIRILKRYDFLKDDQLELFSKKPRRRRIRSKPSVPAESAQAE